jgi:hypothetical protein
MAVLFIKRPTPPLLKKFNFTFINNFEKNFLILKLSNLKGRIRFFRGTLFWESTNNSLNFFRNKIENLTDALPSIKLPILNLFQVII